MCRFFDELGRFSEYMFTYLTSRLRSNAGTESYIKATMNPEPDSWILDYVGWYLTPDGYADPEKSGKVRWFIRDEDGHLQWGDSEDEMLARHGNDSAPMSFTFISASIADNPVLCKLKPGYLKSLKNLPRVERERLLYGNWYAVPESSGFFKRDWVDYVEASQVPKRLKTIRCWDLASSLVSETNPDPDFTACVKMSLCEDGYFYLEHSDEFRERPAGVQRELMKRAETDGRNVPVGIPLDVGAAGQVAFENYARPLIVAKYPVKKMKTRKGKLERFLPFSNAAENGMIKIVNGPWVKRLIQQLEGFDPDKKRQHDD